MKVTQGQDLLDIDTVKAQLNIDYNEDDMLIGAYIRLSLEYMRQQLNNTITENTYEVVSFDKINSDEVYLPSRPHTTTIVLNTTKGVYWKVPTEIVLDCIEVVANTTNTPGAGYDIQQNYKVDVNKLLLSFCERHGITMQDVEDAATQGKLDVVFDTGMKDTYLPNLARMLIIGDWTHNREDSQYYTHNSINHGAAAIISSLQGHNL